MKRVLLVLVIVLFISIPASATKANKTDTAGYAHGDSADNGVKHPLTISSHDKITIQTYYRQQAHKERGRERGKMGKGKKNKTLPPGLQKKVDREGNLPPGWQRKLNPGDVISPEEYEYSDPIPQTLADSLPEQPEGTELIRADDRIFRVLESTREILDVLDIRF